MDMPMIFGSNPKGNLCPMIINISVKVPPKSILKKAARLECIFVKRPKITGTKSIRINHQFKYTRHDSG
jgi:hypothetical protein